MFSFFRGMRDNSGSIKRYFLYAFGEILLVMVGILLALQVNNWNQDRLERREEQMIYSDLKVEFEANLKDAGRVMSGHNKIATSMTELQNLIQKDELKSEIIDSLIYDLFDWFTFTPKPGASNNLINAGNLNLIRNRELRYLLTLWSGLVADLSDDELIAVNYSQDVIIPYLVLHYPMSNIERFEINSSYSGYNSSKGDASLLIRNRSESDIKKLLSDQTFQSHISVKKLYALHAKMECTPVVETCERILQLIKEEMN